MDVEAWWICITPFGKRTFRSHLTQTVCCRYQTDWVFKCNGFKPCVTCMKKNLECKYTPNSPPDNNGPPSPATSTTKRQNVDDPFDLSMLDDPAGADALPPRFGRHAPKQAESPTGSLFHYTGEVLSDSVESIKPYGQVRMLQDPTGRLCKGLKRVSKYSCWC